MNESTRGQRLTRLGAGTALVAVALLGSSGAASASPAQSPTSPVFVGTTGQFTGTATVYQETTGSTLCVAVGNCSPAGNEPVFTNTRPGALIDIDCEFGDHHKVSFFTQGAERGDGWVRSEDVYAWDAPESCLPFVDF
jgi:hypothetical protein